MNLKRYLRVCLLLCALSVILQLFHELSPANSLPSQANTQHALKPRDGQHDFDFHIGTWKTHLKRLVHPFQRWVFGSLLAGFALRLAFEKHK
jgi:hypothetical protein